MSRLFSNIGSAWARLRRPWIWLVLAPLYLTPVLFFEGFGAQAAGFIKIGDIKGESVDSEHKEEIDVLSWSWGVSNLASAGKVEVDDFQFTKPIDKASPILMLHVCHGSREAEAAMSFEKVLKTGNKVEYMQIKLSDVLISSYQISGSSGDVVPVDSFSLNFNKIEMTYIPYDESGQPGEPVTAVCDLSAPQ